jgi:GTP-binding protein
MLHAVFDRYEPWMGELRTRSTGSIVADRTGSTTGYAIKELQDRVAFFVAPGADVYEGMVVGENPRPGDMDVNVCREKKLTNMRASSSDTTVTLVPPRLLSLEAALEFIEGDECVEVTPSIVRIRKVILNATERGRLAKSKKPPKL